MADDVGEALDLLVGAQRERGQQHRHPEGDGEQQGAVALLTTDPDDEQTLLLGEHFGVALAQLYGDQLVSLRQERRAGAGEVAGVRHVHRG